MRNVLRRIACEPVHMQYYGLYSCTMGKHRETGACANWESNDVMIFCHLCLKEIELGNRPTSHFCKDGWINLTNNFLAHTGKSYDRTQMKNKWDQLNKECKLWRELNGRATGLGWDPIRKTIAAPEEWWKERLEVVPSAKKFRFAGIAPELEEKMEMMFTNVVATGELAWAPNSKKFGKKSIDEHEVPSEDETQDVEQIPNSGEVGQKRKDRGKKAATRKGLMSSTMDSIAETSRIIGRCMMDPPSIKIYSSLYTIPEAIQELEKHEEVMEDSNYALYDFGTLFLRNKQNRETFMSIRADRRVKWLKTRFEDRSE